MGRLIIHALERMYECAVESIKVELSKDYDQQKVSIACVMTQQDICNDDALLKVEKQTQVGHELTHLLVFRCKNRTFQHKACSLTKNLILNVKNFRSTLNDDMSLFLTLYGYLTFRGG